MLKPELGVFLGLLDRRQLHLKPIPYLLILPPTSTSTMAKAVLDALKATGAADLSKAIEAVSASMFKIKERKGLSMSQVLQTNKRTLGLGG